MSDMPHMRCFFTDGMKTQNDAILESIGMTEEIIDSLTRLLSKTNSLLSSFLFLLGIQSFFLLVFFFFVWKNYSKSHYDSAAKRSSMRLF